ncbi:uncharacterized protein PG986_008777 [Apiospora aurea]|uniref:Apple domain-containing protein n=1 Tax=Apiospora aurea TaxID=335848 RepID=A0ABR1Q729_9PEZI
MFLNSAPTPGRVAGLGTAVVDGPTDISTSTITETATITEAATSTAYTTSVVNFVRARVYRTITTYTRNMAEAPITQKLKKKRGDRCPAKPKPSHSASTTGSAPSSTATSNPADALKSFADDVVSAAAPTVTDTVTMAFTAAAGPAATTTAVGATFEFQQQIFYDRCVPFLYRQLYTDVAGIPLTADALFQYCAARCVADDGCGEVWISHHNPVTRSGLWCVLGGTDHNSGDTWLSNQDFQCRYPPIGATGTWYHRRNSSN